LFESLEDRRLLATVNWDGGGDATSWLDPLNWDTDELPSASDDVVIDVANDVTITHPSGNTTVNRLQSHEAFVIAGGTLTVNGASVLSAGLTIEAQATLIADGPAASLVANGVTDVDSANLIARNGGVINLPELTSYTHAATSISTDVRIEADGVGSLVNLGNVTTVTGSMANGSDLFIRASNGGKVDLSGTTSIEGGLVHLSVDGDGDEIDLTSLTSYRGHLWLYLTSPRGSSVKVRGGGRILAPNLTTIESVSLSASAGGILSLPSLSSYTHTATGVMLDVTLEADGAGSVLDLGNVTTLAGSTANNSDLFVRASNGGKVDLSGVTSIEDGLVHLSVDGDGDEIDLTSLASYRGHLWLYLTSPRGSSVKVRGGGRILAPNLATIESVSLSASSGGVLSLPSLSSYTHPVAGTFLDVTLEADGAGSVLDLGNVTTLAGSTANRSDLFIRATSGGRVDLSGMPTMLGGSIHSLSSGLDSLLDLSSQTAFDGSTAKTRAFTVADNGTIDLSSLTGVADQRVTFSVEGTLLLPQSTATLTGTLVTIASPGVIEVSQLNLDAGSTLTGSGTVNGGLSNAGHVTVEGTPATLAVNGDFTQTSDGKLTLTIGGLTAGAEHGQLVVAGTAELGGSLELDLADGYRPDFGDEYEIVTFDSRNGEFTWREGLNVGNGVAFYPDFSTNALSMRAEQVPDFTMHLIDGSFDGAEAVFPGDLDGDGDVDFAVAGSTSDSIAWYEYDSVELTYQKHVLTNSFDHPRSVVLADLDEDGDLDIVACARYADEIAWWENEPQGFVTKHTIASGFDGPRNVVVADLDADADLDVIVSGQYADEIAWWENDGALGFTKRMVDASFDGPTGLAVADVDDDGHNDVVAVATGSLAVAWWQNDGTQSFTRHVIGTQLVTGQHVQVADLDDDGHLDIVASGFDSDDLAIFFQGSEHLFTRQTIAEGWNGSQWISVADMDADDDLDIVAGADNGDRVGWWENRGNRVYHKALIDTAFNGASGVFATDMDGDGDVDILGAADDGDDIAWWENDLLDRPRVIQMTPPVAGAVAQGPDSVIVRLTEDVDPTTVTADTFLLAEAGEDGQLGSADDVPIVADSITYHSDQRLATFQMASALADGLYQVTLTDEVTDLDGVPLDGEGNYQTPPPSRLPSGDGQPGGDFVAAFWVDSSVPTNPERLRSASHTVGLQSTDDTVDIVWTAAHDTQSGLAGYHAGWDFSADSDPTQFGLLPAATTSITSPPLGDGDSHFFHLIAVDRAGNLSEARHFGPISIENGGPVVHATFPEAGQTVSVPPLEIAVQFLDDDVASETLTPTTFLVERSGGDRTFGDGNETQIVDTDGIIDFDPDTRTAAFITTGPLSQDMYRIVLRDSITDQDGNALDGDNDGVPGGDHIVQFDYSTRQEVSGALDADTSWRGLIVVTGTVTVAEGVTLTMEPGTTVKVDGSHRINVNGELSAEGTREYPVVFTSYRDDTVRGDSNGDGDATAPRRADWGGLYTTGRGAHIELDHAVVRFANYGVETLAHDSSWRVSNSIISDNNIGLGAHHRQGLSAELVNTVVANNWKTGIYFHEYFGGIVRNCTIVGNGFANGWAAAGVHQVGSLFMENTIVAFNRNGFDSNAQPDLDIKNSLFYNPAGKELKFRGGFTSDVLDHNSNIVADPRFVSFEAGDYELDQGSPAIDSGRGIGAPRYDLLGRPRHDDPGMANVGSGFPAYVDMGAFERQTDTTPVDLVVTHVAVPEPRSVQQGDPLTVSWTVANNGQRLAEGPWEDAVYLSQDASVDPSDILLGTVKHSGGLAFGQSYTESLATTVPAAAGMQYVLVRTNHTRTVRESTEVNNIGVSAQPLEVGVANSELDTPLASSLTRGDWQYFRFDASAGNSIRFTVDAVTDSATIGLYFRQGTIPTLQQHDQAVTTYKDPDPELLAADPLDATYYIGVYGQWIRGGQTDFTLTASMTDLQLDSVSPTTAGNTGNVTFEVVGENLTDAATVVLVAPDGVTQIEADSVRSDESTQLYATFDLVDAAPDAYDVVVTTDMGQRRLDDAITVTAAGQGEFFLHLGIPSRTRPGRTATLTLTYGNGGTADVLSPMITLTSDDDMQWRVPDTDVFVAGPYFQLMALSSDGPANILRPGQVETYDVKIRTPFRSATLPYASYYLTTDAAGVIDWDDIQEASRPAHTSPEVWDIVWANMESNVGSTWGDYVAMLGENAAYLDDLGQSVRDVSSLFDFEVLQASGLSPYSALASSTDVSLNAPGLPIVFHRTFGASLNARNSLGTLGYGWTHNYDIYLRETTDGTVLVYQPTGGFRAFRVTEDGNYDAQAGDYGTLTATGDGGFSLREKNGTVYRFDADLLLASISDPNGNTVTATHTDERLAQLEHSSGQSLDLHYDASGRLERLVDHTGREVMYQYDATGEHLLFVTKPGDREASYQYDMGVEPATTHALLSISYPDDTYRYYEYDSQGRLSREHLGAGAQAIQYAYDSVGTLTATDLAGARSRQFFDARGRIVQTEDPLDRISRLEYDASGQLVRTIRPDGIGAEYEYDGQGNMIRSTDAMGYSTDFGYDTEFGNLLWFRDARGNTTHYGFDANGNLTSITYPNATAETFNVELFGNVSQSTNRRGQSIGYAHDEDGLLVQKDYPNGISVEYTYDDHGNILTAVDASGVITMQYDTSDRLTRIEYPSGRFLEYTYDAGGRRTQIVDQDGFATNYEYDALGRLDRLTEADRELVIDYTYDEVGRLAREDKGNGTYTTYQYDDAWQLLSMVNYAPDSSVQSHFHYTYDELGRRDSMSTHYGTWTYKYDLTDQLIHATLESTDHNIPIQDLSYEYDTVGNRIRTVINGEVVQYSTNSVNQYMSVGSTTYEYDADGSLAAKNDGTSVWTYEFDYNNRLVTLSHADAAIEYEYNALGHQSAIIEDGKRTELLLDPSFFGNIVATYDADDVIMSRYIHGNTLIATSDGSNDLSYVGHNALGHTIERTNSSGNIVSSASIDPFGNRLTDGGVDSDVLGFLSAYGVRQDPSGLYSIRARSYEAAIGRFISVDPHEIPGSNLYTYAKNSPVTRVDIDGFKDIKFEDLYNSIKSGWQAGEAWNDYIETSRKFIRGEASQLDLIHDWGVAGVKTLMLFPNPLSNYVDPDRWDQFTKRLGDWWYDPDRDLPYFLICEIDPEACDDFCSLFPDLCDNDIPNFPSWTPEDKFGPVGFDAIGTPASQLRQYVIADDTFEYRIDFWNDPTAEVPTQDALIIDQLDANLDWSTLSFTNFGFLKWNVDLPGGQVIDAQVDMRPDMNLLVNVEGTFDPETGEIRWWFQAVDPDTGDYPEDPYAGFLPPFNEETQYELGWVEYTVKPKADLKTGDQIENLALVQFDFVGPFNPAPKDENGGPLPWVNTIDAAIPEDASHVEPLPTVTTESSFTVRWTGQDDDGGSGISSYDIYYRVDDDDLSVDDEYLLWLDDTAATEATFDLGEKGHRYSFYAVATDNVGHQEAAPVEADARIMMVHNRWQNALNRFDVDDSGYVSPVDVLMQINYINSHLGDLELPTTQESPPPFYDASGNGLCTAEDVLLVIMEIDRQLSAGAELHVDANREGLPNHPEDAISTIPLASLDPVIDAAISRLQPSLDATATEHLRQVTWEIIDLPGSLLGWATANHVYLDSDAAGYGWFVDPTPMDDTEFSSIHSTNELTAWLASQSHDRVDLLTTVMHELGHLLGYGHSDERDLMHETLPLGTRRLPGDMFDIDFIDEPGDIEATDAFFQSLEI